jgi:hypothetical protein
VNGRFGGRYHLHLQGKKSAEQETNVQLVHSHKLQDSSPTQALIVVMQNNLEFNDK